jgi:hypothetical protein
MILNQNRQKEGEWRKWFAWYPVYVREIDADVWLQTIERNYKLFFDGFASVVRIYKYRMPKSEKASSVTKSYMI